MREQSSERLWYSVLIKVLCPFFFIPFDSHRYFRISFNFPFRSSLTRIYVYMSRLYGVSIGLAFDWLDLCLSIVVVSYVSRIEGKCCVVFIECRVV